MPNAVKPWKERDEISVIWKLHLASFAFQDIVKELVQTLITTPLDKIALNRVIDKANRENDYYLQKGLRVGLENDNYNIDIHLKEQPTITEIDRIETEFNLKRHEALAKKEERRMKIYHNN